jgi:hypothetical protein
MSEKHAPAHKQRKISRAIGIVEVLHESSLPDDRQAGNGPAEASQDFKCGVVDVEAGITYRRTHAVELYQEGEALRKAIFSRQKAGEHRQAVDTGAGEGLPGRDRQASVEIDPSWSKRFFEGDSQSDVDLTAPKRSVIIASGKFEPETPGDRWCPMPLLAQQGLGAESDIADPDAPRRASESRASIFLQHVTEEVLRAFGADRALKAGDILEAFDRFIQKSLPGIQHRDLQPDCKAIEQAILQRQVSPSQLEIEQERITPVVITGQVIRLEEVKSHVPPPTWNRDSTLGCELKV